MNEEQMKGSSNFKHMAIICFFLSGCNRYSIETNDDRLQKTQACSLKNNLLTLEPGYFSGTRRLELNLDKVDNETVVALFSLSGMNKNDFFKPKTCILFTLINPDNSREEIRLTPIVPPQDKTSQEPIYVFLHSIGYMGVLNYQEKTAKIIKKPLKSHNNTYSLSQNLRIRQI